MKKCLYCAEDIQSDAIKCKHCGEMLVAGAEKPTLPQASPHPGMQGWKVAAAVLTVVLGLSLFTTTSNNPVDTSSPHRLTKAEWKKRIGPYDPRYGAVQVINIAQFKRMFGEPDQTQTIELTTYWYFTCSDGTIQLVLIDPNATQGLMAIKEVNDF